MATVLTPYATWNDSPDGIISCQYINNNGRQPGYATLVVEEAESDEIANTGTLVITDGQTSLPLLNCRKLEGKLVDAKRDVSYVILDRRWHWDLKFISGWYNQRDPLGYIKPETLQTIPQLIKLLMTALGETSWDSDPIPAVLPVNLPAIDWDVANAGDELEKLLQPFGFQIAFQPFTNRIKLCLLGNGNSLPDGGVLQDTTAESLPTAPATFTLQGKRTWYTAAILLEAVGAEPNGLIKPIAQLSYAPAGGWNNSSPPSFGNVTVPASAPLFAIGANGFPLFTGMSIGQMTYLEYQALAQECIYRWYRITIFGPRKQKQFGVYGPNPALNGQQPLQIPGYTDKQIPDPKRPGKFIFPTINSIEQIVLGDGIHTNYASSSNITQDFVDSALVYGSFLKGEINFYGLNRADGRIDIPFTIDNENKIVKFSRAVYRTNPINPVFGAAIGAAAGAGSAVQPGFGPAVPFGNCMPAWLVLVTSVQIRDGTTYAINRFSQSSPGFTGGDGVFEVFRDDIGFSYYRTYDPNTWLSQAPPNEQQVIKTAQQQATAILNSVKSANGYNQSDERHYDTIQPINNDGAIRQVVFSVGGTKTLTTASVNTEHVPYLPKFELRQIRDRLVIQNLFGRGDGPNPPFKELKGIAGGPSL